MALCKSYLLLLSNHHFFFLLPLFSLLFQLICDTVVLNSDRDDTEILQRGPSVSVPEKPDTKLKAACTQHVMTWDIFLSLLSFQTVHNM